MTQRFDELYISRGEHQQIIAYYQKLVVHIFRKMRALQAPDPSQPAAGVNDHATRPCREGDGPAALQAESGNVVRVDFRQRCLEATTH